MEGFNSGDANMEDFLKDLKKAQSILSKHKNSFDIMSGGVDPLFRIDKAIRVLEVSKIFSMPFKDVFHGSDTYFGISLNENIKFFYFSENSNISFNCNAQKPVNEWLAVVSFPCGMYTLHDNLDSNIGYQKTRKVFNSFFEELESFQPKYRDLWNHCLYFTPSNFIEMYKEYYNILRKYKKEIAEVDKLVRIEHLQNQLNKLKA